MDIENCLINYRLDKSLYREYTQDIIKNLRAISQHEKGEIENIDEIIERLSLQANVLSDMPHASGGAVHSTTETVAFNFRRYLEPSQLEINALKAENEKLKIELQRCKDNIDFCNKILDRISSRIGDRERFIIEGIYIFRYTHFKIITINNERFEQKIYTSDGIAKLKKRVLELMSA